MENRIGQSLSAFDRIPPHDADAERALLGSLALANGDKVIFAKALAIVDRDCLFEASNQVIFDVLVKLHAGGAAIDAISLRDALASRGLLDEVGGVAYLGEILNSVPSFHHAAQYAEIVREKSLMRALIALGNDAINDAYSPSEPGEARKKLADLAAKCARVATAGRTDRVHRVGDIAREIVAQRSARETARIPTGLRDLDQVIGGLMPGGTTIIAGKAGMGKSALLKQILNNIAAAGVPVGLISIEESRGKIVENILSGRSGVINGRIAFRTAGTAEWEAVQDAADVLQDVPMYVVDSAATLSSIVAAANLLAFEYGCRVIAVDHVHLIDGEVERQTNREREISKISGTLKNTWKALGVAGIEAAQLNRSGGRERPNKDHLRDSGSLGQDGDVIMLLHRDDYYRRIDHKAGDAPLELDGLLELVIDKNKDGAPGVVTVNYDEARYRITDWAPDPADIPEFFTEKR